jgi:hypothetical protein
MRFAYCALRAIAAGAEYRVVRSIEDVQVVGL